MRMGIKFSTKYTIEVPPTHDQLDAAIAAYVAYLFTIGNDLPPSNGTSSCVRLAIKKEGVSDG